ncbi:MAG: DUF2207 domain-containing protein, partial [Candidatus ainarchaeum sp.]|nr:DUF2207 domain-containing protein [Candidatus ainarchaeum sp.]
MNLPKIFLVFIALILLCAFASAKSYSLEKAEINMQITPGGLVHAEEKITFDFSGSYSFAYRDFEYGEWKITNLQVFEGGKPLQFEQTQQGNGFRVTWHFSASNEKKAFTIKYDLEKAVTAYNDVAEFYWKIWGNGWEKQLREITGTIELPEKVGDANEVYSWGHPALNGKIGLIENKKIFFQAFNIPAQQWVELRIAFPRKYLPETTFAIVKNSDGLQGIIAEEQNWEAGEKAKKQFSAMLPVFAIIFVLVQLGFFALCWYKWGREPKIFDETIYEREVPFDYSPAIVSALMHQFSKTAGFDQITGEILHLCLKGKLKLEKIAKGEFNIHIVNRNTEGLAKSEKMVFEFLSDAAKYGIEKSFVVFKKLKKDSTPETVSLEELKLYIRQKKTEAFAWAQEWQACVKEEAEEMDFFSEKNAVIAYAIGSIAV